MTSVRVHLESLLRMRKLDGTLTSERPWVDKVDLISTGIATIDEPLGGGLRRGQLSEIVGPRSSGRTLVLCRLLAAAAARGEAVALVDPCDRFDPASAATAGLDLSMLLWVRLSSHRDGLVERGRSERMEWGDRGYAARALKAVNLVLQAGGFGIVAFDLSDVPVREIQGFPYTTWARLARVIEGSQTAAVIVGADRIARSAGGGTILLHAANNPQSRIPNPQSLIRNP